MCQVFTFRRSRVALKRTFPGSYGCSASPLFPVDPLHAPATKIPKKPCQILDRRPTLCYTSPRSSLFIATFHYSAALCPCLRKGTTPSGASQTYAGTPALVPYRPLRGVSVRSLTRSLTGSASREDKYAEVSSRGVDGFGRPDFRHVHLKRRGPQTR
jgi:hypothetical protein